MANRHGYQSDGPGDVEATEAFQQATRNATSAPKAGKRKRSPKVTPPPNQRGEYGHDDPWNGDDY